MKRDATAAKLVEELIHDDVNMAAAALLHDMAALQPTERSQFGYKRAAKAIVGLPVPVSELVSAGSLRDVPFIGPSSARIIDELVDQGPLADRRRGGRQGEPARTGARAARIQVGYLSHFALQRALAAAAWRRRGATGAVQRRLPDALDVERRR